MQQVSMEPDEVANQYDSMAEHPPVRTPVNYIHISTILSYNSGVRSEVVVLEISYEDNENNNSFVLI